jgi:phage-related protein
VELPELKARVSVDIAALSAAKLRLEEFGLTVGKHLGRGGTADTAVKDAESSFSSAFKNMGNAMGGVQTGITTLLEKIPLVGGPLAALGGVAGPVAIALSGVVAAAAALAITLVSLAAGLTAALTIMGLAVGVVGGLAGGIVALAAVTQGWNEKTKDVPTAQAAVADAVNAHQAAVLKLDAVHKAYSQTATHTAAQTLALQQAQQAVTDTQLKLAKSQEDLNDAMTGASNPLQKLKDHLSSVADQLGAQAVPAATALLGALDKLVDPLAKLGSRAIDFLNAHLDKILQIAGDAAGGFLDAINKLAPVFGKLVDMVLNNSAFGKLAKDLEGLAVGAIQGLIQNLVRLSNWFLSNLPEAEKIGSAVFGALGAAVQGLGAVFGWVTNQVLALITGHSALTPILKELGGLISSTVVPAFQALASHHTQLAAIGQGLILVLKGLGAVFVASIEVAIVLVAAVLKVIDVFLSAEEATQRLADTITRAVGGAFSALGSTIRGITSDVENAIGAVGRLRDHISNIPVVGGALHTAGIPGFQAGGLVPAGVTG